MFRDQAVTKQSSIRRTALYFGGEVTKTAIHLKANEGDLRCWTAHRSVWFLLSVFEPKRSPFVGQLTRNKGDFEASGRIWLP